MVKYKRKRLISFLLFLLFISIEVPAQHRESENILDKLVWNEEMLNIMIDNDPLTTVVRGTGKTLEDRSFYDSVYIN